MQIKTYTYSNAVVRVHFPDIDEAERRRRLKGVQKAAEVLLKAVYCHKNELSKEADNNV